MIKAIGAVLGLTLLSLSPHVWPSQPTVRPESVSSIETGVWWVGQPKVGPALPTPPTVPAGDLWVSSTPAGTVAVTAVRFNVGTDDRQPIINLPIDSVTTLPAALPIGAAATILACPATGSWKPPAKGSFGALSAAPAYDCGKGQVIGAQTVDGKAIVFDVGQFVTDTNKTISVVLLPATVPLGVPAPPVALPVPLPATLVPPTFNATFKPLTTGDVEVLTTTPATPDTGVDSADLTDVPRDDTVSPSVLATTPVTPAPQATTGITAVPREIAQAAAQAVPDNLAKHERTAAAAVFLLLCGWAWIIFNQDPTPGVKQRGRPYRTLYDGAPAASKLRRMPSTRRIGKPPSLR